MSWIGSIDIFLIRSCHILTHAQLLRKNRIGNALESSSVQYKRRGSRAYRSDPIVEASITFLVKSMNERTKLAMNFHIYFIRKNNGKLTHKIEGEKKKLFWFRHDKMCAVQVVILSCKKKWREHDLPQIDNCTLQIYSSCFFTKRNLIRKRYVTLMIAMLRRLIHN